MPNLGTDYNPKNTHSIVNKLSNLTISQIKPRNPNLPQPLSKPDKRKKNPNLQSIKSVSNHLANHLSGSLQKENTQSYKGELLQTRQKNRQSIGGKVPFANATNSKPLKSFSINSTKPKTQPRRQLGQKQSKQLMNSPKESDRSGELPQKPIQKKLFQPSECTRKRIKTYRIHLSSSKDKQTKQNQPNSHNRVLSTSQQRQLLPIQGLQLSKQKTQSSPGIDSDLTNKVVTNRQKGSHSFMIRKKINSTVLQGHQRNKENREEGNVINWSKCYRKDRFVRDEVVEGERSSRGIEEKIQLLDSTKTRGRQQIAQHQVDKKIPTQQSQKSSKRLQPLKPGKPLKMRNKKFSKPQQDHCIQYDEIFTQPNNNEKIQNLLNQKFQQSLQGNLGLVKSRTVEYEKKKMREVEVLVRGDEEQKRREGDWLDNDGEPELCEINAFYQLVAQHLLIKPQQNNEKKIKLQQQSQLLATNNIKLCKRRVSSIRALKSLYRNAQAQPKTQLGESRNGELSKRREKEASCLTHKIKWGNTQGKRKEMQEGGKEEIDGGRGQKQWEDGDCLRLEMESIRIEKLMREKSKNFKKARFMDEEIQKAEHEELISLEKKNIEKKSNPIIIQNTQIPKPSPTISSHSTILFQDPGLSIIVKKNSSLQSSAYEYTTIEQDKEKNDQRNDRRGNKKHLGDNLRVESLKELFLELKSHQSIEMEQL